MQRQGSRVKASDILSIGELAARTGAAVSALRFYEQRGLIAPFRNSGGQRRFVRSDIRRVAFILIAQQLGLGLGDIAAELNRLPAGRTPNAKDWHEISLRLRQRISDQITRLEQTRDRLDGCIGCGCLSLTLCTLYNPQDRAARLGHGPRYVMGDNPAADASAQES